jgi:hypothetical protein
MEVFLALAYRDPCVGDWAHVDNVELAYTPTNLSYLNRIGALRRTALPHPGWHRPRQSQATRHMIHRYIAWQTSTPTTSESARSPTDIHCLTKH